MASYSIAIIGGTGPQGRSLAYRFALAGHHVLVGSRAPDRAEQTAEEVVERAVAAGRRHGIRVAGKANRDAAAAAEIVALAVPYDGHAELVGSLRQALTGKTVVSCVNPLGFDAAGPYGLHV